MFWVEKYGRNGCLIWPVLVMTIDAKSHRNRTLIRNTPSCHSQLQPELPNSNRYYATRWGHNLNSFSAGIWLLPGGMPPSFPGMINGGDARRRSLEEPNATPVFSYRAPLAVLVIWRLQAHSKHSELYVLHDVLYSHAFASSKMHG